MKKYCPKCAHSVSMWRVFGNQVTCSYCGTKLAIKGKAIEVVAILAAGVIAAFTIQEEASLLESLVISLLIGAAVYAVAWMAVDLEVVDEGDEKRESEK